MGILASHIVLLSIVFLAMNALSLLVARRHMPEPGNSTLERIRIGGFVQDDDGSHTQRDSSMACSASRLVVRSKRQRSVHFDIRDEKYIKYTLQTELQYRLRDS